MARRELSELDGRSWSSLFGTLETGVYRQELPRGQRIAVRVLHAALFLAAAVLFLAGSAQGTGANRAWYVIVPEVLVLACMLRMLSALIVYLPAGAEMSAAEHNRSAFALKRTAVWCAVLQLVTAAAAAAYCLREGGGLLAAVLFAVSTLPMAAIYAVERSIWYSHLPDSEPN